MQGDRMALVGKCSGRMGTNAVAGSCDKDACHFGTVCLMEVRIQCKGQNEGDEKEELPH